MPRPSTMPPARKSWSADARNWYNALGRSELAAAFQPADWQLAKIAAATLTRADRSEADQAAAIMINRFHQIAKDLTRPSERLSKAVPRSAAAAPRGRPQNVVELKDRFG